MRLNAHLAVALGLLTSHVAFSQDWRSDPDLPPKRVITRADVLRWMPVSEAALAAPSLDMRLLAGEVAAGSNDARTLRAYWRSHLRHYPYDVEPPADLRARALAQKHALAADLMAPPTDGCWAPLGPRNIPGRMTALVLHPTDPDTIFTGGADGGVWKSADLGATWSPLSDAEGTLAVGAMAIDPVDPNLIYVGTGEANYAGDNLAGLGLMKTTDGGSTWSFSNRFASSFHEVRIDPSNRTRLWAATRNGLFRSDDSGGSWTQPGGGYPADHDTITVLVSAGNPQIVMAGAGRGRGGQPGADTGLYRSIDGGGSWSKVPSFPQGGDTGRIHLAQTRDVPSRVWAAVHSVGNGRVDTIHKSDDEGATWTPVSIPTNNLCNTYCWYCLTIGADPADPDVAYVGGVHIYRTDDGGSNWTQVINTGGSDSVHVDQHWFLNPAPGEFWAAHDGGINRTTDAGATWSFPGFSLETAQYYHLSIDRTDDTYTIGGTQDNGSHRYAGAAQWSRILGADGAFTAIDWVDPRVYYASTQFLGMYRSRDRGGSFTGIGGGIDGGDSVGFIAPYILDRSDPSIVYAGTTRLWKSTDQGDNFVAVSPNPVVTGMGGVVSAIDNCRDFPDSLWVGSSGGDLAHSPDGGGNWDDRTAGLPNRAITSVSAHPTLPGKAYVSLGGTGSGHLWKTEDSGATWVDVSATLPDIHFNHVLILEDQPQTVVAAADLGIYRSDDDGASWYVFGDSLPNVAVDWLAYSPNSGTIRAGTHGRGAWQLVPEGTCPVGPSFSGLRSVALSDDECLPELTWGAATVGCPAVGGVSYNIYRSTDPLFAPGPLTLLEAGYAGTSYIDRAAATAVPYHYVVRAEDAQTGRGGPANDGWEDANQIVGFIELGDPAAGGQLSDDAGDSDLWMRIEVRVGSAGWSLTDADNTTPGGRYAYRSVVRGAGANPANTCATLETPELRLLPGAELRYQASYNLEQGWDGVVVEISTDGGMSWNDLPPAGGYPGDFAQTGNPPINRCDYPAAQGAFSGPPGNAGRTPFQGYTSDLGPFAGQSVRVRWVLSSDPGSAFAGLFLDDVIVTNVAASGVAPDVGNVLLGVRDVLAPHFTWTDRAPATSYRLYHAVDRTMAGRAPVGGATSGVSGVTDTAPRPEPVHYYRVHGLVDCVGEGP